MANIRKYQETTGYWVYGHITPNGMIYIGMSKQQPWKRWNKSKYKEPNSLAPYIAEYGWENIQHKVFIDGLTKEQAETLEGLLILQAIKDNWCINEKRSGGLCRDDNQAYMKQWEEDHNEERKAYYKQYNEEHKDYYKQYNKQYKKQYRSTPEGKIYMRVGNYNRYHTPIETPAEAKQKYLEFGYIPNYIKNDDL